MAAVETTGSPRRRTSISVSERHLLVIIFVMTIAVFTTTLLITLTTLTENSHCAAAVDNRKQRRSLTENDSVGTTGISTSGYWRYVVNNVHLCDAVVDDDEMTSFPVLVVVVHSRPGQRGRMQRDAIRVTWGSSLHRRVAVPDIRLVFMLGRDPDCEAVELSCSEAVWRESRLYGDVIVSDVVDNYRSLSLKALSGLLWARHHCRAAHYIVKVDDDVYLRPDLLPQVRQLVMADSSDLVIVGSLNVNSTVQRRGLWRVDERAFPAPTFPPYCSGNVYAMASSVADRVLAVANTDGKLVPFPLEDVYITALLATAVGARCVHDDAFPRWDVGPSRTNIERLRNGSLLAIHNVHYTQMYDIRQLLNKARETT